MEHTHITRREFFVRGIAASAGIAAVGSASGETSAPSAVDLVPFGKTGLKICRLGMGTGSMGGAHQRDLGQEGFTRLVRYAYDQGIRYIDTADAYRTHEMIREAIRDIPREELWIQSKIRWSEEFLAEPLKHIDRFRKELGTDYIDSVLVHCVTTSTWAEDLEPIRDALSEAKEKGWIRLKGSSAHGLPGLTASAETDWCDMNLVRVNPQGKHVDGEDGTWDEPGKVDQALVQIRKMHQKGRGIIGMKIIGNGSFTNPEDRERSIRFAMACKDVDAVVIGFKAPEEIDEAIRRMNAALKAQA
jgi:predicted aldo/keto reductase-like oxidoreductase